MRCMNRSLRRTDDLMRTRKAPSWNVSPSLYCIIVVPNICRQVLTTWTASRALLDSGPTILRRSVVMRSPMRWTFLKYIFLS